MAHRHSFFPREAYLISSLRLLACVVAVLLPTFVCRAQTTTLYSGSTVTREITPNETHPYELELLSGQLITLVVSAGDLNFSLRLVGERGNIVGEVIHRRYGDVTWQLVVAEQGRYRLEVSSLESSAQPRRYQLKVEQVRAAGQLEKEEAQTAAAFSRAEVLRFGWQSEDLAQASRLYKTASLAWQRRGRWAEAAEATQRLGEVYFIQGDYSGAHRTFDNALRLSRRCNDLLLTLTQLNSIGYVYIYLGDNDKAFSLFSRIQAQLGRTLTDQTTARRRIEAQLQNNFGEVEYARGKLKTSLDLFARALTIWMELGDRRGMALAHLNAGYARLDSGSSSEAAQEFEEALRLWHEVGDMRGEALTLTARGDLYSFLGDKYAAVASHREAREMFHRIGDQQGEAVTSNALGDVFERLNLKQDAIDNFSIALRLNQRIENKAFEAVSDYYLGHVYQELEDFTEALRYYGNSLALSSRAGKSRMATHALMGIAEIKTRQRKFADALDLYRRCLGFYTQIGDLRRQALTHNGLGELSRARGDAEAALAEYRLGLELFQRIRDPQGEAESHYWLAKLLQQQGRLPEALTESEQSVSLIESQRARALGQSWRSAYFASVRNHFELQVDILMQLHKQQPEGGFAARALQASERARARSLLELLAETQSEIRHDVDGSLLARERQLQNQMSAKSAYQIRALNSAHPDSEVAEIERDIRQLASEYDFVQAQIQAESPDYALLTEPQTLTLPQIQAALKEDEGTVLLEYILGDERSYVWLVTPEGLTAEELPSRQVLEAHADEVYRSLSFQERGPGEGVAPRPEGDVRADEEFCPRASQLSETLLGPLVAAAGAKRLLVVADGRLHYIPFDALPLPAADHRGCHLGDEPPTYVPLLTAFEVIHLPSFSSLALLRRAASAHPRQTQGIAIWADPVFEHDDPRVTQDAQDGAAPTEVWKVAGGGIAVPGQLKQSAPDGGSLSPSRLLSTQDEAENIMRFAPVGAVTLLTGFNASRESVLERDLHEYSILHFATHGLVDASHPSLSGLLLSTFDEQGRPRNGLLQLHDIYGLRLNADLVVLSGCDTGLGQELSGEGLVGLTQGFLYAGSKSVVVSLWKVKDNSAAMLMSHFYEALLKEGIPPAVALRRAKLKMYQEGSLRSPSNWSAFILQGEFRPPASAQRRLLHFHILATALAVLAVIASVMYSWLRRGGPAHGRVSL